MDHAIMQTTCCVQSGTSGGPVVSCDTGQILAMMVSNAVSATGSKILYPRFNMAIPSTVFKEPIRRYAETGGECVKFRRFEPIFGCFFLKNETRGNEAKNWFHDYLRQFHATNEENNYLLFLQK